jgi:hypothetical protein
MTPAQSRLVPLACAALLVAAHPAAADEPRLELVVMSLVEAWNDNGSRETLSGGEVTVLQPLRERFSLTVGPSVSYVDQRGVDAYTLAATVGVRWRAWSRARSTAFAGLSVGASRAELPIPPRGTRFNYILRLDGVIVRRVARDDTVALVAGVTWLHLSNNGLAGRDRNPDIQALGFRIGVSLPMSPRRP